MKNPFRYRSYYYDFETNLYYLNSRYYDPETGRFVNADDIAILNSTKEVLNGLNLYTYCLNNPVNEVDETGYILWWLIAAIIIGAIIGGAVKGVTAYKEGDRGWNLFGSILGGAIMGAGMGAIVGLGGGIAIGAISGLTFTSGALLSVGIGLISGWTSYTTETLIRNDKEWNIGDFGINGFTGILKGLSTFFISYAGSKYLGTFDKINLKPALKNEQLYNTTLYKFAKTIIGRKAFLSPTSEFLIKSTVGGISALVRKMIDWIFNI